MFSVSRMVAAIMTAVWIALLAPEALAGKRGELVKGRTSSFSTASSESLANLFGSGGKGGSGNIRYGSVSMIVRGVTSSIIQHPYMASIQILVSPKHYSQNCGGTLLNENHVLSAGHCFRNRNVKLYRVRVGSDCWETGKGAGSACLHAGGQISTISKVFVHPKYNDKTYDYDVSVVKLSKRVKMDGYTVKSIKLVKQKSVIPSGTLVDLVGWGYQDALHTGTMSNKLQQVQIRTLDWSDCSDAAEDTGNQYTTRMFCGADDTYTKGSCQGDSGGPVMKTTTGEQIGIISWALGCAQEGSPGNFVNLSDANIHAFINRSMKL